MYMIEHNIFLEQNPSLPWPHPSHIAKSLASHIRAIVRLGALVSATPLNSAMDTYGIMFAELYNSYNYGNYMRVYDNKSVW